MNGGKTVNTIRNEYRETWRFIRENKRFFWIGCIGFFAIMVIVALILSRNAEATDKAFAFLSDSMQDQLDALGGMTALSILFNNMRATLVIMLLGAVPFVFIPALLLIENAGAMSIVLAKYIIYGLSIPSFLAGILPHGIFELPAIFLAFMVGCYLCLMIGRFALNKDHPPMGEVVKNALRTYVLVIIPLLMIAAPIEVYLTPKIMALF